MKKRILFFPQNNEHVLNMDPVIDYLLTRGFECDYLDTRKVYKQRLQFNPRYTLIEVQFPDLESSFYQLGSVDRISYLRSVRGLIKDLAHNYDMFVFGNDGAIQRLMINYAKREKKTSVMILDGLVGSTSYSWKDVILKSENKIQDSKQKMVSDLKHAISILFSGSALSPYLPSTIGSSNLDEIYTIGNFSKSYIDKHKHRSTQVFSYGLPRMKCYFDEKEGFYTPKQPKSICFITSAYKWHNLDYFHKLQIEDIIVIKDCIKELYPDDDEIKLIIKLHPRESKEDYDFLLNDQQVVLAENEPLTKTFANYTLLLSNISTCIVEGLNEGVKVSSLMINFPFWKFRNGFLKSSAIDKIFSKQELMDTIKKSLNAQKIEYSKNTKNDFLAKDTLNSVENISNNIIELSKR